MYNVKYKSHIMLDTTDVKVITAVSSYVVPYKHLDVFAKFGIILEFSVIYAYDEEDVDGASYFCPRCREVTEAGNDTKLYELRRSQIKKAYPLAEYYVECDASKNTFQSVSTRIYEIYFLIDLTLFAYRIVISRISRYRSITC